MEVFAGQYRPNRESDRDSHFIPFDGSPLEPAEVGQITFRYISVPYHMLTALEGSYASSAAFDEEFYFIFNGVDCCASVGAHCTYGPLSGMSAHLCNRA